MVPADAHTVDGHPQASGSKTYKTDYRLTMDRSISSKDLPLVSGTKYATNGMDRTANTANTANNAHTP